MDGTSIGTVALWGAVATSAFAALSGPAARRKHVIRVLYLASLALAFLAVIALVAALVTSDLALEYVARTTSRATPLPYRVAALWGAMEGSLLFYTTLTLAVGSIATRLLRSDLRY